MLVLLPAVSLTLFDNCLTVVGAVSVGSHRGSFRTLPLNH